MSLAASCIACAAADGRVGGAAAALGDALGGGEVGELVHDGVAGAAAAAQQRVGRLEDAGVFTEGA